MGQARSYTMEEFESMAKVLGQFQTKDTPASVALHGGQMHGEMQDGLHAGLFTSPGVRPDIFSTLQRFTSFLDVVPMVKSEYTNDMVEILTGALEMSGTNATGWCADPPTLAPPLKVCMQRILFGRFYGKTQLEAIPEIGHLKDRADTPRQILNASPEQRRFIPDIAYRFPGGDTRSQLQLSLYQLGISAQRNWAQVAITGSDAVASTATELGFIREFDGLEQLITTGYTDFLTTTACPASDSQVKNWGGADIAATVDGNRIYNQIADMSFVSNDLAMSVGMGGFTGVYVMRPTLFRRLTEQIACNYATSRCSLTVHTDQRTDTAAVTQMRLAMQQGRWIPDENGQPVPVIFDHGIPETRPSSGRLMSDMFFVPMSWNGMNLTELAYFPMDNQYAMEWANAFDGSNYDTLNDGFWGIGNENTAFCLEWHLAAQARLLLRTPFLAFRIDNIAYDTIANVHSPNPGETWQHYDGGTTFRSL